MMRSHRHRSRDEEGLALLVTLAVTVILAGLAIHFHEDSMNRASLARNFRDRYRALNLARTGFVLAEETLLKDQRTYFAGAVPLENGQTAADESADLVDELYRRFDASLTTPIKLDGGLLSVSIVDEGARINLNRMNTYSRQLLYNLLEGLHVRKSKELKIYGEEVEENHNAEMTAALVDWIDSDSTVTADGAEDAYYEGLEVPYRTRNAFLQCPEELLLVRDFDDAVLTGRAKPKKDGDGDEPSAPAPTSPPSAEGTAAPGASDEGNSGLLPFITIYGTAYRVNVNTATRTALAAIPGLFESTGREAIIQGIIENRPFRSLSELTAIVQAVDATAWSRMGTYVNITSNYFRVRSTGQFGNSRVTVDVILQKVGRRSRIIRWRQE